MNEQYSDGLSRALIKSLELQNNLPRSINDIIITKPMGTKVAQITMGQLHFEISVFRSMMHSFYMSSDYPVENMMSTSPPPFLHPGSFKVCILSIICLDLTLSSKIFYKFGGESLL